VTRGARWPRRCGISGYRVQTTPQRQASLAKQDGRRLRCGKCHIARPLDIIGWKDCAELTPIARHRAFPPRNWLMKRGICGTG